MNLLFVAGCQRSGTTAFTDYLNLHPEVLICRERYKWAPKAVIPELFTFERVLDYGEGETNVPREHHARLLAGKDPGRLRWIGDKNPGYVNWLGLLSENNPGARFIVLYRPVEEVAESWEARSRNPRDEWLGGKNGFEMGVRAWNQALRNTWEFVESGLNSNVLIVSYHDFFYRNEACVPLISHFLEIKFDETVRGSWGEMSRRFEEERRSKKSLSEEQASFIRRNKDYNAEEWILRRIEAQWEEVGPRGVPGTSALETLKLERRVAELEDALAKDSRRARHLKERVQSLEHQLRKVEGSRAWRFLRGLGRLRAAVSREGRRRL